MATIALAAAGAAVGGALLPTGVTLLGATIGGAALGSQVGALAGSFVDQALFAPSGQSRTVHGPRLSNLQITASTEGAPVPRIYGRFRLGGQVIWATDIEEVISTTTQRPRGGKGRSGGGRSSQVTQVEYSYFGNFAVALCEGPIAGIGRVWADGNELDLSGVTYRIHLGTQTQSPDSLIAAREGAGNAPAYRGVAYVVFENLPLGAYGNRLPQLSFEVHRPVDDLNDAIKGVVIIPGSGEFAYATTPVTRLGDGARVYENVHTLQAATDWEAGIDQLQAALPNARSASLIVSWFGTDLRAGHCQVRPAVELIDKDNAPVAWAAAGLTRQTASAVSTHDGRPAYGGTPSDWSVVQAIADLKHRGFSVTLTPFILMDVAAGNTLPDPYGAASQPPYPWRGRITLSVAPGRAGSPDKTAAAAVEVAAFVGNAAVSDFAISGGSVVYSGPNEWTLRRQVLHYAWLAKAAGGVDAFLIGTELRGLTHIRSSASSYPFVAHLVQLAADVKSILGAQTKVTYAADWSEYFGHQPQDGSGDVYFHLDPLWANPSIDAIGIDLYWPLSDWRDGRDHLDAAAGARSIFDLGYLASNVAGGEGYAWYYASASDRTNQIRTPITDGAGKPWVFRYKDLTSWWSNLHYHRPGGVEAASPTAWLPQMKPVWFMEAGCPAVDKGANQPNVFVDPKSAESALPHFSDGRRDDLMQRRYIAALIGAFDPASELAQPGLNPMSTVYGSRMVDLTRIHVYAWDARPFPAFPNDLATWDDGANWRLGHWLNGRLSAVPLAGVVTRLLEDFRFEQFDASALEGLLTGYAIDRIMSAREALQPLELAFFFDAVESGGGIGFRHRGVGTTAAQLVEDDLVAKEDAGSLALVRGQESELPLAAKIAYVNASRDFQQAVAEARRLSTGSGRVSQADLPIVLEPEQADAIAESWLYEAWIARERATFTAPPSRLALEPGDVVSLATSTGGRLFRITGISDHGEREIEAIALDPQVYRAAGTSARSGVTGPYPVAGLPDVDLIDLPLLRGDEQPLAAYVAATQTPWPGAIAIYQSPENADFKLAGLAAAPATAGRLLQPLAAGPAGRLDHGARLQVKLDRGELASASRLTLLGGANLAAVRNAAGGWEVIQFETATLVAARTYELRGLLRAQAGTDAEMAVAMPAGSRFVLLDGAPATIDLASAEIGLPLTWRIGPADRDLGEDGYVTTTHAFRGLGLRPLSPVHLRARRSGADIALSWIRRTRIDGDRWDGTDVPLGEDAEAYEVDIVSGASVVRTIAASGPSATYTAAQQIADFGAAQSSVSVRVHQISAVWGRGSPAQAIL